MTIVVDETGFRLSSTDKPSSGPSVQWQEITTILAFKRDCFVYDLICLAIDTATDVVEINEEDAGWDTFIRAVEKNLPGSLRTDDWLPAVTQPPFVTNITTIYHKE